MAFELVAATISHQYGSLSVLEDISFTIRQGEIVAIVGPSGCGKTTLLNAIDGLLPISAGSLTLNNCNVGGPSAGQSNTAITSGGGLFSNGNLTINGGTISTNIAGTSGGGGIQIAGGVATINGTTISQNQISISFGGGVVLFNAYNSE